MTQDQTETLQMLFSDIKEDAEKGEIAETKEEMEECLQSILSSAGELQNLLFQIK